MWVFQRKHIVIDACAQIENQANMIRCSPHPDFVDAGRKYDRNSHQAQ
jgi:hypothetical protein